MQLAMLTRLACNYPNTYTLVRNQTETSACAPNHANACLQISRLTASERVASMRASALLPAMQRQNSPPQTRIARGPRSRVGCLNTSHRLRTWTGCQLKNRAPREFFATSARVAGRAARAAKGSFLINPVASTGDDPPNRPALTDIQILPGARVLRQPARWQQLAVVARLFRPS